MTERAAPWLAVVLPVYNGAGYLRQAMDSVLAQTFRDFEVVVVDDGSTDESSAIIAEYAAADPRVRPVRNERNLGVVGALNRGVAESRAPLIARMDADDICLPERFERQLRYLEENPDVAVLGTFYRHMSRDGAVLGLSATGPVSRADFRERRRKGEPTTVCHPTAMFSRRLFAAVGGYDPAMFGAEDLDLFDRMADHGPVIALTEPLLLYRIHSSSEVMKTFFEARVVHRLVRARGRARSRGLPPPTLEEYLAEELALPWWKRLGIRLEDASNYRYRSAGLAWSVGERGLAWRSLALSIVLRPDYALPRIWSQRLSPRARRALRVDGARDPV